MASKSDRRWFLKLLPQTVVGAAAIATVPTILNAEVVPDPAATVVETRGLTEEEMIAICNSAAVCFGLKPRTMRHTYKDISGLGA